MSTSVTAAGTDSRVLLWSLPRMGSSRRPDVSEGFPEPSAEYWAASAAVWEAISDMRWSADFVGDRFENQSPEWRREQEQAFDQAQAEVRGLFRKCPGCNKWVCETDCWNEEEGLCVECAPREAGYVAQARNRAMRRNIDEAAETAQVWQGKLETRTTVCPNCGKPAGAGKFCNECGAPLGNQRCPNCGAEVALGVKFCGECGTPMQKSYKCVNCGYDNPPGTKFCSECGTKL